MSGRWVCTKCDTVGNEPEMLLLDNTYGSGRCLSTTCKREKRIFHLEVPKDDEHPRPAISERHP